MALLLGTKKKVSRGDNAEYEVSEPQDTRRSTRRKKKQNERLDSVISESVTSAALGLLRNNKPFELNSQAWVILVLHADSIGGLSMKHSNNEAKGSIIEHIEQDQIQVLATAEMLVDDHFGIIPTPQTLEQMSEYSLLQEATYVWTVVTVDDNDELKVHGHSFAGVEISEGEVEPGSGFDHAMSIAEGTLHISEVLPDLWEWAGHSVSGSDSSHQAAEDATEVIPAVPAVDDEAEDPMSGATSVHHEPEPEPEIDYGALEADDEPEVEEFVENEFTAGDDENYEPADSSDPDEFSDEDAAAEEEYLNYLKQNEDRVVDEEEVRDSIARRFLSDDLDLQVDLAEFNTVFASEAPAVEFSLAPETSDWLGAQVNQLARQANAELMKLHRDHADELRETYVQLMSQHVEAVLDQVSLNKGETIYKQMNNAADAEYEEAMRQVDDQVALQRKEITERFHREAEQRAEQAAANARIAYTTRHQPKHEQELAEVGGALLRRNEERRDFRRRETLQWRQAEARKLMDLGSNQAMKMLSERQAEQREVEMEIMRQWSDQMSRFLEENRKNDLVRAETLATQLEKDTRVEELRGEYARRLEENNAERDGAIRRLQEELATDREVYAEKLKAQEQQLTGMLNSERSRAEAATATVETLTKQIGKSESRVSKEYKDRIAQLSATIESLRVENDRTHANSKRQVGFLALLMIVFSLMAVGVGLVLGWAVSSGTEPQQSMPAPVPVVEAPAAPAPIQGP